MTLGPNQTDSDTESNKGRLGLLPVFYETAPAHQQYIDTCGGAQLPDGLQPIPTVMQRFAASYFTGKLEIFTKQETATMFFDGGNLIHAQLRETKGDNAVREAVSWLVGACSYNQNQRQTERTITRQLQSLVREGFVLLDQKKLLSNQGLFYESTLRRARELDPVELKKTMGELQRKIFTRVESACTLTDLIRDLELETWEWVPAVFHLLDMQLLQIHEPRAKENVLDFINGDDSDLHALESEMVSTQTGLYNWEALVLYLQREVHYHRAYKRPLSFIVMEMESVPTGVIGGKAEWLPSQAIATINRKFGLIKKPLDIFGHFEESDFALILPNTSQSQALFLAKRLAGSIANYTVNINMRPHVINMHCGIATVPDIGSDLHTLLSAAKHAKIQAKNAQQSVEVASLYTVSFFERSSARGAKSAENEEEKEERSIDLKELLLSAGAITIEQLDQASGLMSRMPVPLSLGRVLSMQGEIKESVISGAEELSKMVGDGRMIPEQAMEAIELIACHDLDLKSALRRMNIASRQPEVVEMGQILREAQLITERRLMYAARQSEITELPLSAVLIGAGILPRSLVRAANDLAQRITEDALSRDKVIAVLQSMHERSLSLQQALSEQGVEE